MKPDEIAKLPTPITKAQVGFANFNDAMKGGQGNIVSADLARRLEQDRAALIGALNNVLEDVWNDEFWRIAEETLAAVKERE